MPRYVVRRLKAEWLPYVVMMDMEARYRAWRWASAGKALASGVFAGLSRTEVVGRFLTKKEAKYYAFMKNEEDLIGRLDKSLKD